jgi:uncharacterized protein
MKDKFSDFKEIVSSLDSVREVIGEPIAPVLAKELDYLDDICRDFIAKSPFLVLGSVAGNGHVDLSPKGDPPGFVKVLDDHRLAIPDRPGNRRVDSFQNILKNPQVGIIFIIPGTTETLRIRGEARIVRDRELRESLAVRDKIPEFALVVAVETAFMHCPKCMIRSGLWEPEQWSENDIPDIGRVMVKHAKLNISAEELEASAREKGLLELY